MMYARNGVAARRRSSLFWKNRGMRNRPLLTPTHSRARVNTTDLVRESFCILIMFQELGVGTGLIAEK